MADPTGNEPAAPVVKSTETVQRAAAMYRGLTKREHFAGLAMQGVLAGANAWPDDRDWPEVARRAVVGADALIAELAKAAQP